MTMFNKELFQKMKDQQVILSGVVRITEHNTLLNEDVLMLEHDQVKVYIPRSEVEIREIKYSLIKYVGRQIEYVITEINEEEQFLIASSRIVKEQRRETQLTEVFGEARDKEREATVVRVLPYGAYVEIDDLTALLQNKDFSLDHTTVEDMLKPGDKIVVKFSKAKPAKIYVEAIEKICHETSMTIHDLTEGQLVTGVIRTIKTWGCYTNLLPNLDGLSPVPQYFEVSEGMKVIFKINQVREDGRVRGKIVRVLPKDPTEPVDNHIPTDSITL